MAAFVFLGIDGLEAHASTSEVLDSNFKGGGEISISVLCFNPKLWKDCRKMLIWKTWWWFYYVNWFPLHNASSNPRMANELRSGGRNFWHALQRQSCVRSA